MTKAELISNTKNKTTWACSKVREVTSKLQTEIQEDGTLKLYELDTMVKQGETLASGGTQSFYVINEGTETEEAYFAINEKADTVTDTFSSDLKTYIETITPAEFLKVNIDKIDTDDKYGIVTAYVQDTDAGIVSPKQLFVYQDTEGEFIYTGYEA